MRKVVSVFNFIRHFLLLEFSRQLLHFHVYNVVKEFGDDPIAVSSDYAAGELYIYGTDEQTRVTEHIVPCVLQIFVVSIVVLVAAEVTDVH